MVVLGIMVLTLVAVGTVDVVVGLSDEVIMIVDVEVTMGVV